MARGEIADRIRDYLKNEVEVARGDGGQYIKFRAGDISKALKALGVGNAQVCNVLKGKQFHSQARVKLLKDKTTGPPSGMGGNVVCHYEILGQVATAEDLERDAPEPLRQQILGLTPAEFQELTRYYWMNKGFSKAEINVTLSMTV